MSEIKLLVVVIIYSLSQPGYVYPTLILILAFLTSHTKRVPYKTAGNARDLPCVTYDNLSCNEINKQFILPHI